MSLQQLVHSRRRKAAIGQEEGRERLIGSQVFSYWEIYSRKAKANYFPVLKIKHIVLQMKTNKCLQLIIMFWKLLHCFVSHILF